MNGRSRVVVAFLSSWVMFGVLAAVAPVDASAAVTDPGGFTSLAPARLLDTRSGLGAPTGPVAAGGTVALEVLSRGGVPDSGVSAVVLNVTVAEPAASGYVTVYGYGTTRPTASNLNYVAGQVVPNLVVAPVGTNGKVTLYNGSPGTTHLIADVSGYFLSGNMTASGTFASLAPSRLLDTRSAVGVPTTTPVSGGGTLSLQVTGRGGVPSTGDVPSAVVLNVTVAEPTASGYVTVYGDGTTRPLASNLNYVAGQVVPNLVVAPVGAGGKVALYNGSPGTVQLIADVAGYFLPGTPTAAGALRALAPNRLLDTRTGVCAPTGAVAAGGTVALQVAGRGGVPASGASAVVLNVTVAEPTASGYLTVYGEGTTRPTASNLNYVAGQVVPNLVIAPVGAGGKVALYNGSGGTVQLIADVSAYFLAEAPPGPLIQYSNGLFAHDRTPAYAAATITPTTLVPGKTAWSWGDNEYGQLGGSTWPECPVPGQVGSDTEWSTVSTRSRPTVAIKTNGTLWMWPGSGTQPAPEQVGTDTDWASAVAGVAHTVAVKTDGTLWAWGENDRGQLGDGTTTFRPTPVRVGTDTGWASVSAGLGHTVAVKTDGSLWAWGYNAYGQLGYLTPTDPFHDTMRDQLTPLPVGTDTQWASVAAGDYHTVAVKADGTLWAWGWNYTGALGDGTNTDRYRPVQVGADTHWASVAAGLAHSMAIRTDGTLWAWGYNLFGQLGDGTGISRLAPVQVGTDVHWASVAAGEYHTVAVKADGTLWAWGLNDHGQVGDSSTTDRYAPVPVGTGNDWVSVAAGMTHTVGLRQ